jgi:mono/diheme cytochrome c family protein
MRRLLAAFIAAGIAAAGVTPVAWAQRQPDPAAAKLPDGAGKDAVLEFCAGACHQSDKILAAQKTAAEWHATVLQMQRNGAQLFPEDVDAVSKYLATYLATDRPTNAGK